MASKNQIPTDNNILNVPLEEAMPDNFLPYAVEVAKDRALPDVRDGLKPVHRRILYGAYQLKAFHDKPYYKSARIVGDILGKYHPHGDSSVYDAMVILAQDFSTRMPLIDGHGNWGSIDGDSAAAMRYTEARLSRGAEEMLRDIDKDTVEFVYNYSDTELEPKVLPSRYPNLLVNGAFGIAVGLATNIPPHNMRESIGAVCAYIDDPDMDVSGLMQHIKGPDFPTGGVLIGGDSLKEAYEKGEGKVVLRANAKVEKLTTGRFAIVVTEFPYRKNKAKLLQQISAMTADKKHQKALDGIMDIRDESDRNGVRAVIEFKKQIDLETAEKILLYLYKRCDLQININFNMVALYKGKPSTMGLKDIIRYYVEHQREVVLRRTKKELDLAMKRFHIVEGFMKAIDIMDQVIKTIRESSSKTNARENLVKEYGFSEEQATAILELMLYRLTGLELKAYVKEHNELSKLIKSLEKVINSQKALDNLVKKELLEVSEDFGDERRTEIIKDEEEAVIDAMDIIVQEDVVVTISREGFIKRMPLKNYQRVTTDESSIDFREGDELAVLLESNTKDVLYIFSDSGMLYQLKTMDVPEHKWKDKGVRMDNYIKGIDFNEESIIGAFTMDGQEEGSFKFITSRGSLKRTDLESFKTNYSKIIALKLRKDEKLVSVILEKSRVLYENTLGELLPKVYKDYIYENKDQLHMVELPQVPLFVRILTKNGLDFTVPEADVEVKERMSIPDGFLSLPDKDEVYRVHYEMDYEAKAFNLTISDRGEIKVVQRASRAKNLYKVSGESYLSLVIVTSLGAYYKLPMYMFENLEGSVILSDLYDDIDKSERVVGVFTLEEDAADNQEVYFVTEEGIVKRTSVEDFRGEGTTSHVIKFKKATDRLVYAEAFSGELDEDILLVSEKGMAIRFETSSISLLSRNASGVVGMNLKDEDRVFFAKVITEEKELVVGSKANDDETMKIEDIKLQNRATRGKSIMMLVLGDKINKVEVN